MAFYGINEQNKQRVSISQEAYTTITHDVIDFNLKNINSVVNAIISYREKNNITQDAILREYRENTANLLKSAGIDPDKDDVLDKLCNKKKNELRDNLQQYGKRQRGRVGVYVRINNSMRRWLEDPDNPEGWYYDDYLEPYLNHILEDYATKDLFERELIITHDRILELNAYIKDEEWINLFWDKGTDRVFPYMILPDKMRTHAYLACYKLNPDESKFPISYRISALPAEIKIAYGYNPDVTQAEKDALDDMIRERRVDFLAGEAVDIIVQMTEKGFRNYIRTSRLRPDIVTEEKATKKGWRAYIFHCTELQAEYYFSRLGGEVEILAPISLRKRFKELHQQAASLYK